MVRGIKGRGRWPLMLALASMGSTAWAQTSGSVTVTPGFMPDPQRLTGIAGGPVQAQTLANNCRGWISQQPNHAINVASGMQFLRTFVDSQTDTVMVIRAPNGQVYCNDDTWGLNPDIDAAYGPGQYLVWVGTYQQGASGQYTIAFSELRSSMPAGSAAPVPNNPGIPGVPGVPSAGARQVSAVGGGGPIFDFHTTSGTAMVRSPCNVSSVELDVRGTHTFFSDLTVRLRSPSGDSDTLQSHGRANPFRRYNISHFNGQSGAGPWTLSVEDSVGQDGGRLSSWTITLQCN